MFFELSMVTKNCSISVTGGVIRLLPELVVVEVVGIEDASWGSFTDDIEGVPHSFLT